MEAKDIDLKLSGDDAYSPQGSSQKSRMMLSSKSMVRYLQCPLSTPILDCPFLESNKVIFDIKDNPFLYVSNSFFSNTGKIGTCFSAFCNFLNEFMKVSLNQLRVDLISDQVAHMVMIMTAPIIMTMIKNITLMITITFAG